MSATGEITVGAVAYHPRVVTIWESFRDYFRDRGVLTDYVLYSNYERLVRAVLEGSVDMAGTQTPRSLPWSASLAAKVRFSGCATLMRSSLR